MLVDQSSHTYQTNQPHSNKRKRNISSTGDNVATRLDNIVALMKLMTENLNK